MYAARLMHYPVQVAEPEIHTLPMFDASTVHFLAHVFETVNTIAG
jgi:hypothetical protein